MDRFWVLRLRREGAPIPRWQQSQAAWVDGRLRVVEERDDQLRRSFLVARLTRFGDGAGLLPALFDARLLQLDQDRLVLAGFERDVLTSRDVAQTWLLRRGPECPRGAGLVWGSAAGEPARRSRPARTPAPT